MPLHIIITGSSAINVLRAPRELLSRLRPPRNVRGISFLFFTFSTDDRSETSGFCWSLDEATKIADDVSFFDIQNEPRASSTLALTSEITFSLFFALDLEQLLI